MKLSPKHRMDLWDDDCREELRFPPHLYPLPCLCHLEPLPTHPQLQGALGLVEQKCKKESLSLQGFFQNSLLSIQMGGPIGYNKGGSRGECMPQP